jgi:hypothetical protein
MTAMSVNDAVRRSLLLILILAGGCVSGATNRSSPIANDGDRAGYRKYAHGIGDLFHSAWERVTPGGGSGETIVWDWATGIPAEIPRAEVVAVSIPVAGLAEIAPQSDLPSSIQLASTGSTAVLCVSRLHGKEIDNFADLQKVVESLPADKTVQLDVRPAGSASETPATCLSLDAGQVIQLQRAAAPESPIMRVSEDGNPWVLIRQQNVLAKLMIRVERRRGLVQVIVEIRPFDESRPLPLDLRVSCNDVPQRCLTAAEAMSLLYGERPSLEEGNARDVTSFAAVSERDDYLIPTNYQRLEESFRERSRHAPAVTMPAFMSLRGMAYPGSAVLGDARALSAFLLQREIHDPSRPQTKLGWVVYGGQELKEGGQLRVDIDLGNGPLQVAFQIPAP